MINTLKLGNVNIIILRNIWWPGSKTLHWGFIEMLWSRKKDACEWSPLPESIKCRVYDTDLLCRWTSSKPVAASRSILWPGRDSYDEYQIWTHWEADWLCFISRQRTERKRYPRWDAIHYPTLSQCELLIGCYLITIAGSVMETIQVRLCWLVIWNLIERSRKDYFSVKTSHALSLRFQKTSGV